MASSPQQTPALGEGEFMRLFLTHEITLRAFARALLPDWNAVDDALQEASVTMWEKRGQLKDEEGFLPWAKVILRFKCLSAASSVRRHRRILSDEILSLLADEAEGAPADELARVRRALKECLNKFSRSHQDLLLAPYLGDGRVKQLAGDCGKSVNSLYKLLGRLREKLGGCIRGHLGTEGL